ncbi:UvrD-helicase domain-containing protein [Prevotella brevis]|uniref:DNA 3'-5' helicase n=1 Tax=Xylanibacter brevis TaxID=83231 RepID=A0ABS9CI67_9BACT|nr:UvrD-helicase domain-containing protein [Xylanibacter brevis]MCF2564787.1 UvrD-helicase domain-containing protein [Xylanibacter brevis]
MKNIQYINAGAGSGKTTKLTQILSEELGKSDAKIRPSEVILTTFTELAASEFRERSRQQLFQDGHPDIAAELDSATIGTVHSVALSFIQRYWYLIGVSPDMKVMSEEDLQVYISESLGEYVSDSNLLFFNDYRAYFDLNDQGKADFEFWKEHLRTIIDKANNYSVDIERSKMDSCAIVEQIFSGRTLLDRLLLDDFIRVLASEIKDYSDNQKKNVQPLLDDLKNKLTYSVIVKIYKELTEDKPKMGKKNRTKLINLIGQDKYDALVANLKDFQTSSEGDESPGGMMKKMIDILFDIAKQWKDGFNEFKTRRHIIDYNDMERLFLELLSMPQVADEIKGTYKLMMVDEFQDSSPIQLEIFKHLSDIMEQSYWVGDPKQSIYGFRGADVELVSEITRKFLDTENALDLNLTHSNLPNSWRTREPLVELTNDCFTKAFDGIISKENVVLKAVRHELPQFSKSLSHWNCSASKKEIYVGKVADRIKILKDSNIKIQVKGKAECRPIRYGDIAVLCRTNQQCKDFANALIGKGIPVSFVNNDLFQQTEVQLVFTLLKFMVDSNNKHVRADLMRLLEGITTQEILLQRLDYLTNLKCNEGEEDKTDLWLEENSLMSKLIAFKRTVKNLSVRDLIESIIYGLALPVMVAKWGNENNRRQNLQTLCILAKKYDEHCLQMGIGASVGGLLTYLSSAEIDSKIDNASDAVKVLTYHGSKGLEWYYVILSSLEEDSLEEKIFVRKSFWGVREMRHPEPSDRYSYIVQFLPRIVSTKNTNLPQQIIDKCKELPSYNLLVNKECNELRHLLYVGMTRARDYLTTLSHQSSPSMLPILSWIRNTGISDGNLNGEAVNLWYHNPLKPVFEDITDCPEAVAPEITEYKRYKYPENPHLNEGDKFLSPSKLPILEDFALENIEIQEDLDCRIAPYKTNSTNQADAGTCIHNIFAVYDPKMSHEQNVAVAERIRNGHNMYEVIPDIDKVIISIEKLYSYLEVTYGKAYKIGHETPFMHALSGQIVHGEIDLLWYLNEHECVLIDYKNFPGGKAMITNPDPQNDHYAGKYAPQLKAYREMLQASGLTVKDALIYYSVMGCVVRLKM